MRFMLLEVGAVVREGVVGSFGEGLLDGGEAMAEEVFSFENFCSYRIFVFIRCNRKIFDN